MNFPTNQRQFLYFAYGSNMLKERLVARCSSARVVGKAFVRDYCIEFSKVSKDGSGKATIQSYENSKQYGVLFKIDQTQREALDRAEGLGVGYEQLALESVVNCSSGEINSAYTYQAINLNPVLVPFDWYLALVIAGAEQHGLPANYIASLRQTKFKVDPSPKTDVLDLLNSRGIQNILEFLKEN